MIYILDYDVDIAFVLNRWLRLNGFEVKSFTNLEQLLLNLEKQHPDWILLDCRYGQQSLLPDVCRTIRTVYNYTGRIIVTSTTTISDEDLQLCNADGFVAKPFNFGSLVDVIHQKAAYFD